MKKNTDTILGWAVVIAIVVGIVYLKSPKKPPAPTVEVKVLSANVNGRLYTKEAGPNDFASQYVVMPADDNSGEAVILPWSVIKVSTHKMRVGDLVDGMAFYNKFVEDLRARNDPLLPEALRIQGQLAGNLTPQQANAIYQEMLRRQQVNTPR